MPSCTFTMEQSTQQGTNDGIPTAKKETTGMPFFDLQLPTPDKKINPVDETQNSPVNAGFSEQPGLKSPNPVVEASPMGVGKDLPSPFLPSAVVQDDEHKKIERNPILNASVANGVQDIVPKNDVQWSSPSKSHATVSENNENSKSQENDKKEKPQQEIVQNKSQSFQDLTSSIGQYIKQKLFSSGPPDNSLATAVKEIEKPVTTSTILEANAKNAAVASETETKPNGETQETVQPKVKRRRGRPRLAERPIIPSPSPAPVERPETPPNVRSVRTRTKRVIDNIGPEETESVSPKKSVTNRLNEKKRKRVEPKAKTWSPYGKESMTVTPMLAHSGVVPDLAPTDVIDNPKTLRKIANAHLDKHGWKVVMLATAIGIIYMPLWRFLKNKPITDTQYEEVRQKLLAYFGGGDNSKEYEKLVKKYKKMWKAARASTAVVKQENGGKKKKGFDANVSLHDFAFADEVQSICSSFHGEKLKSLDSYARVYNRTVNRFEKICSALDKRISAGISQGKKSEDIGKCVTFIECVTLSYTVHMCEFYDWHSSLAIDIFALIISLWRKIMFLLYKEKASILRKPIQTLTLCIWKFEDELRERNVDDLLIEHYNANKKAVDQWMQILQGR